MGCGSSKSLPISPDSESGARMSSSHSSSLGGSLGTTSPDQNSKPIGSGLVVDSGGSGGAGGDWKSGPGEVPHLSTSVDGFSIEDMEKSAEFASRLAISSRNGRIKHLPEVQSVRSHSGRRENLAFEVPASAELGDSLIKKHPPKKFQKLEEQQPENMITPELLEEKQDAAERRRKEILSQRVKSAKNTSARSAQARARAAESKAVDELILSEQEILSDSTNQLLFRPQHHYLHHQPHHNALANEDNDDSQSQPSRSTLSSANTTVSSLTTPQTSAHLSSHRQPLEQLYHEEFKQIRRGSGLQNVDE